MLEFARVAKALLGKYPGSDHSFKGRAQILIDYFGDKEWTSICPSDIQQLRGHLSLMPKKHYVHGKGLIELDETLSTASVNKVLAAFGSLHRLARDRGILPVDYINPCRFVPKARENNARKVHVRMEDCERLLDQCVLSRNRKLAAFVAVAISCGARLGNLQRLQWGDIDLVNGAVMLADTKNGETLTSAISPRAIAELKRIKPKTASDFDLVFGKMRPVKAFKTATKEAGLDKIITRIHDLRAVCASISIQRGLPTLTVQKILGHKTESMTRRYAALDSRTVVDAVNRVWA